MSLTLDIARSHLETLIERLTGIDKAVADHEDDYFIRSGHAGFFARVDGQDVPVIRVYSVVADEVDKSPTLFETLNELNTQLSFLRAMWIRGQVLIEGELLALTADAPDFTQVCRTVAMATDHFGPIVLDRCGGRPVFEATKEPGYDNAPGSHPGYL